jgi:ketosteroid isomerase-like protein
MTGPNTDADVSAWIAVTAVKDLIVRYSDAATRGDWDAFAACWMPDARWITLPPIAKELEGIDAILADLQSSLPTMDFFVQMALNPVVTLDGPDRARATTTIHALGRKTGAFSIENYAIYYDEVVKSDGVWRFAQRRLQPVYLDTSEHPGAAPISRADLARLG